MAKPKKRSTREIGDSIFASDPATALVEPEQRVEVRRVITAVESGSDAEPVSPAVSRKVAIFEKTVDFGLGDDGRYSDLFGLALMTELYDAEFLEEFWTWSRRPLIGFAGGRPLLVPLYREGVLEYDPARGGCVATPGRYGRPLIVSEFGHPVTAQWSARPFAWSERSAPLAFKGPEDLADYFFASAAASYGRNSPSIAFAFQQLTDRFLRAKEYFRCEAGLSDQAKGAVFCFALMELSKLFVQPVVRFDLVREIVWKTPEGGDEGGELLPIEAWRLDRLRDRAFWRDAPWLKNPFVTHNWMLVAMASYVSLMREIAGNAVFDLGSESGAEGSWQFPARNFYGAAQAHAWLRLYCRHSGLFRSFQDEEFRSDHNRAFLETWREAGAKIDGALLVGGNAGREIPFFDCRGYLEAWDLYRADASIDADGAIDFGLEEAGLIVTGLPFEQCDPERDPALVAMAERDLVKTAAVTAMLVADVGVGAEQLLPGVETEDVDQTPIAEEPDAHLADDDDDMFRPGAIEDGRSLLGWIGDYEPRIENGKPNGIKALDGTWEAFFDAEGRFRRVFHFERHKDYVGFSIEGRAAIRIANEAGSDLLFSTGHRLYAALPPPGAYPEVGFDVIRFADGNAGYFCVAFEDLFCVGPWARDARNQLQLREAYRARVDVLRAEGKAYVLVCDFAVADGIPARAKALSEPAGGLLYDVPMQGPVQLMSRLSPGDRSWEAQLREQDEVETRIEAGLPPFEDMPEAEMEVVALPADVVTGE